MPLYPNVPHIVGDDDDEYEEQSENSDLSRGKSYLRSRESNKYNSEEEDEDSWYNASENDNDDYEDISSSSEADDYMVRGDYIPSAVHAPPIQSNMSFLSIELTESEPETSIEQAIKGDNRVNTSKRTALKVPPISSMDADAYSRRQSLRSATRKKVKEVELPPKVASQNNPLRQRRSLHLRRSPLVKVSTRSLKIKKREAVHKATTVGLNMKLAKPLEITQYFNRVSARLVSERVEFMPFLTLRGQIDRLVREAIGKTKKSHIK